MNKVIFYGSMKEYFPEPLELIVSGKDNYSRIISMLEELNPLTSGILNKCRLAANDEFVELNNSIKEGVDICILPPASGG